MQLFLNQTDSRYWKYNGRSDVSSLSPQHAGPSPTRIAPRALRSTAWASTPTSSIPTRTSKANLAYFEAMMQAGRAMGIRTLVTEAGHYLPDKPAAVPYDFREDVWKTMVATGKQLAALAERNGVTVLFEAFYRGSSPPPNAPGCFSKKSARRGCGRCWTRPTCWN